MWSRRIIYLKLFIGLLFSFLLSNSYSQIQSQENYSLISFFVKPELTVKSGELSFNVINIANPGDTPIRIKPYLNKPEGWAIYSTAIKDTIIQPGDTLRIPFRVKLAVDASSDIIHNINFEAYSTTNQLLTRSNCVVHTTEFHNWSVNVTSDRIFFLPRLNQAKFNVYAENKGNTAETIELDYNIGKKIKLFNADGSEVNNTIYLRPNSDTIIPLIANYTFSEDKQFDLSRIQLNAATPENSMVRSLVIEKYKDTYNPLRINEALPHTTELGVRFNSDGEEPEPFLNARGNTTFKNESTFSYNFANYDLTATESFIENSFYNFLYKKNELNIGLGSFSSTLGRNLYSQNGIMLANTIKISETGDLQLFGDQDFLQPISSVAAGYVYHKNKLKMNGSVAYNYNQYTEKNTASINLNSGTIPLFRDHTISANIYAFREENYYGANFFQMGVGWNLNYFGWIGKQISFQLTNNYGSPDIPGSTQGLLNNGIRAFYYLGMSEKYFSATYFNTRRNYFYYSVTDSSVVKQPNIYLYNQYGSVLYNNHYGKFFRWSSGPSVQIYKSEKPYNLQGDYEIYQINRIGAELNTEIGDYLTFNIKGGFREIYFKRNQEINLNKYDVHLITGFRKNGYGLSVSYDLGPLVNTGLYQSASDFDYNGINITANIIQNFLRKRFSFQVFANYNYRFDLDYGNVQVTPKLETYIARNWYIDLKGNYGYYVQNSPEYQTSRSIYYTEISIVKNWGKTDYAKWQKKLRRLKVVMYQDDNGNGIKDNFEKGIPYVKTRLKLTVGSDQTTSGHFPIDIALLSNERGTVTFNQIPQGFYELEITPLADVGEYFYVDKTNKQIDIVKNTTVYIPFQKADKIEGQIEVIRSKFIKEGSPKIDLSNIKVTAYNNSGNSYSSFTTKEGKFIIFVPGDTTYFVRMQNVFGNTFVQKQNDIEVRVPDPSNKRIVFEFVELQRNVRFKQAEPTVPDSLKIRPQKVKILEGKIYENAKSDTLRRNDVPDFSFENKRYQSQNMEVGKFYIVVGESNELNEALKIKKIMDENGLKTQLGLVDGEEKYYIFTNEYSNRAEAQNELDLLIKGGYNKATIIRYK